MGLIESF